MLCNTVLEYLGSVCALVGWGSSCKGRSSGSRPDLCPDVSGRPTGISCGARLARPVGWALPMEAAVPGWVRPGLAGLALHISASHPCPPPIPGLIVSVRQGHLTLCHSRLTCLVISPCSAHWEKNMIWGGGIENMAGEYFQNTTPIGIVKKCNDIFIINLQERLPNHLGYL